jgi:hypothetical protein
MGSKVQNNALAQKLEAMVKGTQAFECASLSELENVIPVYPAIVSVDK